MMERRRDMVEPPFATQKECIFGNARFLLRGLGGVSGELAWPNWLVTSSA